MNIKQWVVKNPVRYNQTIFLLPKVTISFLLTSINAVSIITEQRYI